MFEKRFAKYARAVDDEQERKDLYRRFRAKEISVLIFLFFWPHFSSRHCFLPKI